MSKRRKIEVEDGFRIQLLEDVFKLMDVHTEIYQRSVERAKEYGWSIVRESPDLLVSEVYNALTKTNRDWHRTFADVDVRTYTFRGSWMNPARAVFETMLEELGFELYVGKGRAFRIKTIKEETGESNET